jgi:hypothetical protein
MSNLYSPFWIPVNSNLPLLSDIVKLTSEESFLCISVIVALATGCLLKVSKATPLTTPFFCATAKMHDERKIAHKQNCLMAVV